MQRCIIRHAHTLGTHKTAMQPGTWHVVHKTNTTKQKHDPKTISTNLQSPIGNNKYSAPPLFLSSTVRHRLQTLPVPSRHRAHGGVTPNRLLSARSWGRIGEETETPLTSKLWEDEACGKEPREGWDSQPLAAFSIRT